MGFFSFASGFVIGVFAGAKLAQEYELPDVSHWWTYIQEESKKYKKEKKNDD